MASKNKGRMCVVAGCSKRQADGVSVHIFPKDQRQRAAWIRFVKLTRADWPGPSQYTVICSEHFNEDCYEARFSLMKDFGIPANKCLRKGSVPSIYPKRKMDELNDAFLQSPQLTTPHPPPPPERRAYAKRAKNMILTELLCDNNTEIPVEEDLQERVESQQAPIQEESSISMTCQTEEPRKRSVKIQVAAKNKEKGLQVNLQPRVRSIGIQFNGRDDLPTPQVPPAAVPVLDLSSGGESIEEVGSEAASLYEPFSGCASSDDSHIHNNNNEKPYNPLDEEKFIVSRSKLLELFSSCKRCHRHATPTVHQVIGTMARISAECEFCGFTWQWSSQPSLGNIPVGNLGLSASILFSGALAAKVLRVLQLMGVATITSRTFYSHQASVPFPFIARVWNRHQETYARQAVERGEPLIVGGDGRADSPGHCAKFGSYSTIDLEKGIVIDIQLVQSNEVKNSNGMEKRGLERAVYWVKNNDLEIRTIVTDRHLQIQKWIRENLPETTHYYDVWHVAKGLKKKVLATAKQSECGQLSKWSRSLTNHLYWVATSTPNGDGDLMWAKWESVENHVHNKHEGHNELFPSCAHGTLYGDERKKKWIKPGSKASEKISDIILSNQMKRDIPKLSPLYQTSQIEAFHSTVNHFAPKMVAFSYYGMYCRLIVAALHFNENTSRVQAATKEGNMQFKISFPKFKHGEYSVRKRTVDSTYGYVTLLMTETFASMEASVDATSPHQPPVSCLPEIQPPPLCSNFVHPEKSEAVQHFRSRFRRKETPV